MRLMAMGLLVLAVVARGAAAQAPATAPTPPAAGQAPAPTPPAADQQPAAPEAPGVAATSSEASGGRISGTVKAGAVPLPGVGVTATNSLTGKKYATTTDVNGAFAMTGPRNGDRKST